MLREVNGFAPDGAPLASYTQLKDDGSTRCGCWIYCGVYADGVNQAARRKPGSEQSWVAPEWGWAWPANRRMLYNRASADPDGRPWSQAKAYVWWDADQGKWTGHDIPDFIVDREPHHVPADDAKGPDAIGGSDPFVMQTDGKGWLFASKGLADGPLPTHYEPPESPVANIFYKQQKSPARQALRSSGATTDQPDAERRLPLRVHDLPAHGASHSGRDEPYPAVPLRAPAGLLLRGVGPAGQRARAREPRLGDDRDRPCCDRGARARHSADAAAARCRTRSSSRSACPTTGVVPVSPPVTPPTTS